MNQVTTIEQTDQPTSLLAVIAQAAQNPAVDVDKMERLLEMQERVYARQAKTAYDSALAELQPQLPIISERGKILGGRRDANGNEDVRSTYALWEDVNEAIRPLLAEHGFALSFRTGRQGDLLTVTGILSHRDGHREETTIELPSDGSGSKNAVQAIGSSTSYGKRYAAFALLNITSRGEDDDAHTATKYRADHSPMPRAKLDGPHTSKTALRTAVNAIIAEVRAAQSNAEIDAALKKGAETRRQAERDWPALIHGEPDIEEDGGLKGAVEQCRALVAEDGILAGMIRSMKECDTKRSLENWMIANEAAVEALDGAESRRFQMAYDLQESIINEMDQSAA